MDKKILLLFIISIFLFNFISASEPTQQYNKIYLSPFYQPSLTSNINYSYNINVNPPDKISSVKSAIITFDAYINPTRTFNVWVNGKLCNTPSYVVSTTYAGAGKAQVYFDCSNRINQSGNYTVILQITGGNIGATTGWLDLTYMNEPAGVLTLHGTEYTYGQQAKIWLQLLNSSGANINNGVCYADIYTPTGEIYVERATMINMNHDGIYYYDVDVPFQDGVYPAIATCYYTAIQTRVNFTNFSINFGTYDSGTIENLKIQNFNNLRIKETALNPIRNVSVNLSIQTNNICNISEDLLTGISISTIARFNSVVNDDITIWIWNHTSSRWISLPNKILEDGTWRSVSNSIALNNLTKAGLVNITGGNLIIKYNDTLLPDTATSDLDIDYLSLSCDQLSNPLWQEIKGSSEIHVNSLVGEPYYEESLCGEDNEINSACAIFQNNLSYWNYTWGYIEDDLLFINSFEREVSTIEYYETAVGQDCTSLIDILKTKNNATTSIIDDISLAAGSKDNCVIGIPIIFNATEREFNVSIRLDNYMKWEGERDKDYIQYFTLNIVNFCENVATANNKQYSIPIQKEDVSSLYRDNPIFLNCYRAMDDLYWFNKYYNDSLDINVSGEFEGYLLEFRFYYPELKDISEILKNIAKEQNLLFEIKTLCNTTDYTDSSCAKINLPDNIFTSQEGYILENLSVTNTFNTKLTSEYKYVTAQGVDCSAIFSVNLTINGTTTDIVDNINYQTGTKDNCEMRIPISFPNYETSSFIEIYMENYIYWDIYWARDNVNLWNETIFNYCSNISTNRNIPFNLPINDSINQYLNDNEFYSCYRAMDDLYWWYSFYNDLVFENFSLIGEIESYHYESEFFWPRILEDYNTILTYKRNITQILTLEEILNLKNNKTSAEEIWNFANRNLTSFNFDVVNETAVAEAVWNWNGIINNNILSQFAQYIWNWIGSISSNIGDFFATAIWNAPARNLTYTEDIINYSKIGEFVWNNTNRNLTYYPTQQDLTNYSLIAESVWLYNSRNLTYFPVQQDLTNYSNIAQQVWIYNNRNLTYFPTQVDLTNYTLITQNVWSYLNRTLTDYNQSDLTNYTKIVEDVWNYLYRNLTYTEDVTNYSQISEDVWSYVNRNLTFYNNTQQVDLTNYTKIVEDVWTYLNRNLTYYADVTNYTQLANDVWLYSNRSLTEFNFTVDANVNITQIAEGVWYYNDRNLTYFPAPVINNLTAQDVWEYVNRTLTYYPLNNITVQDIWTYVNRTLTYYLPGNNITAEDIWTYVNRNLTYYYNISQVDLTNYTLINQGVWNYSNRTLYFNYGNGKTSTSVGTIEINPLANIDLQIPDPFYFDETYTIYYDPINVKGSTVEISNISVILLGVNYTATTPTILADGRYSQLITIPEQDISTFTIDVNMTQNYVIINQKAFVSPTIKRGGITGFATLDDKTKKNLTYLGFIFLFLIFVLIIVAVVSKSRKKHKSRY